jgi:diketogulonate reductase-like aldo/keto reductase
VDAVADELGVSSSQVALAWVMARHRLVHPIIGARRLDQLAGNLAALQLSLPDEAVRRLDEVSAIELGFPYDSIESTRSIFYGPVSERTDRRPRFRE